MEWSSETPLEWGLLAFDEHKGIQHLVTDLNSLYRREPALHQQDFDWQGFEWIDCNDADNSVLSFIRRAKNPEDFVVVVANFTPVVREVYRLGVPEPGFYAEILNTDAQSYGGGNAGNAGGVLADSVPWMGRPYSLALRLPPLAVVCFKLRRG
jgi:1,4-alpha-glucan branching enzyme